MGSEASGLRGALVGVLLVRGALGLLAVALAASLYERHFVALVFLRPTKEVLLAGGFFIREGDVSFGPVVLAAIPLAVIGVWSAYLLGRSFSGDLAEGVELPGLAGRVLPAERIRDLCGVLERKGAKVVFLGRLAVFPSTVMAAAAGASGLGMRRFAAADSLGMLVAILEVLLVGYLLGEAYEQAGAWLTVVGGAVALALLVLVGRWLRAAPS